MLFRKPKLIKVDVTKTRRNRDGHFAGKGRPYHVVPLSFQASSNGHREWGELRRLTLRILP